MNKILIITEDYFPYGSAMASRILAFCKLIKDAKYEVKVIALHGKGFIDDIDYEILSSENKTSFETFVGNNKIVERTKEYIENNKVKAVFGMSIHIKFDKILKVCKKKNVPLILEQCEWYDVSSYKFGKFDPRFIRFSNNIKNNYKKADGIIAISRLLEKHYKDQECNVIRIPSICDVYNKDYSLKTSNKKIHLVFTGSLSKSKEMIKPILEALSSNDEYMNKICFDIYGVNEKQLISNINDADLLNKVRHSITINGFVPQNKIEDILRNSDYEIFIRPYRRSSNAGFPTKLCESMSVGTPVITNNTGDITMYLDDEINGFVCEGNSCDDIKKIFDKVIRLMNNEYKTIRKKARQTAENSFDYRKYVTEFVKFINNINR